MKIIDTTQLDPAGADLSPNEAYWVYNGLDCCLTSEIREVLSGYMDDTTRATYRHALQMQGPIMDMMLRGVLVDQAHVERAQRTVGRELEILEAGWERICKDGIGLANTVNWRSPMQVKNLLYNVLQLPVKRGRNAAGQIVELTDRETLEQLRIYWIAEPICNYILAMRDKGKVLGFLKTRRSADGRIHCEFNLAGTNTGRLSSSFSAFGDGTNLQNIDRNLRYIFVPDSGKVFINIDLEQADSRNVGALCWEAFHDDHGPAIAGGYLDACESGDLHTTVCRMGWPGLEWGDDPALWRGQADQIAYRSYTYRDLAKKLGHGTNYYGQPPQMSKHSKVPVAQIVEFQKNYFSAFPCIPLYHADTIHQLQSTGMLTHLFGRRRFFYGRHDDQSTINAAIAYRPQGMTGEQINRGILNLWHDPAYELLVQVHDSILLQVDQRRVNDLVPRALDLMQVQLELRAGRKFSVPLEAKVGWNWGDKSESNPLGLSKWRGEETRQPPRRVFGKRVSLEDYL